LSIYASPMAWERTLEHRTLRILLLVMEKIDHLNRKVDLLMSDQDRLDADVAQENATLSEVEANDKSLLDEVDALKKQPQAAGLDFTALEAAIARSKADASASAPAAPATPTPSTPVTPAPAPVDPATPAPANPLDPSTPTPADPTPAAPAPAAPTPAPSDPTPAAPASPPVDPNAPVPPADAPVVNPAAPTA
jgi:hypothetical protein